MPISTVLYARPSDVITSTATLSLTSGSANSSFPLTNAKDGKAHTVFKSTGTGCTIRSHWSSPVTIEGLVLAYHKLAGATVTVSNPAGFSRALTIPANSADGHCIDPWGDYRGLSNVTDDDWDIAIAGAATVVVIGEILWIQTWRELLLDRGADRDEEHEAIVQATDYHPHANVYSMGTRVGFFKGTTQDQVTTEAVRDLHRATKGPLTPVPVIPDTNENVALYAHLATSLRQENESGPRGSGWRTTTVQFTEAIRGLPL